MNLKKNLVALFTIIAIFMLTACSFSGKEGDRLQSNTGKQAKSSENGITSASDDTVQTFPAFEGTDMDGNPVDSSLFSDHAVTVVNFWFTTCNPCIEEMDELEALSQELKDKNGVLVGVNPYTQDGDAQAIADAKEVLEKKGVTYQNLNFGSESEAGKFTSQLFTFPTTYVLDREGNIVGEPIIGGIDSKEQKEKLYKLIEETLEQDS